MFFVIEIFERDLKSSWIHHPLCFRLAGKFLIGVAAFNEPLIAGRFLKLSFLNYTQIDNLAIRPFFVNWPGLPELEFRRRIILSKNPFSG
jgi:hypothetical protein